MCEKKRSKKIRGHCRNSFRSFSCALPECIRDCPRSGDVKRKTTDAKKDVRHGGGRARGRGEKIKEKEITNRRKGTGREKRGEGGNRNSSGSLPSGLVLARSPPSLSFASYSFSFPPYCVLSTLSSKYGCHVFPQARAPTALYACKQPSCVRIRKEGERRETNCDRRGVAR